MDLYLAMVAGACPEDLAGLEGLEMEIIGPDYRNGYTLCGSDAMIEAAMAAIEGRELVRFFVIL
jgi:hypothetical protein